MKTEYLKIRDATEELIGNASIPELDIHRESFGQNLQKNMSFENCLVKPIKEKAVAKATSNVKLKQTSKLVKISNSKNPIGSRLLLSSMNDDKSIGFTKLGFGNGSENMKIELLNSELGDGNSK